jgi:hypothetical protein
LEALAHFVGKAVVVLDKEPNPLPCVDDRPVMPVEPVASFLE